MTLVVAICGVVVGGRGDGEGAAAVVSQVGNAVAAAVVGVLGVLSTFCHVFIMRWIAWNSPSRPICVNFVY